MIITILTSVRVLITSYHNGLQQASVSRMTTGPATGHAQIGDPALL